MLIILLFFADRGLRSGWAKLMGVAGRADMFLMNRAPSCSNYIKCFIIRFSTTVRAVKAMMQRPPMYQLHGMVGGSVLV